MRYYRRVTVLLVSLLILITAPVGAQSKSGVTDRGRNIYEIDPYQGELFNLMPAEDVKRINQLLVSAESVGLISSISPDDQAALAVRGQDVGFVNIQNGDFVPLDVTDMEQYLPLAFYGYGGWAWADDTTLLSIGADTNEYDPISGTFPYVALLFDRQSGGTAAVPLAGLDRLSTPVSLAPNGKQLLTQIQYPTEDQQSTLHLKMRLPAAATLMPKYPVRFQQRLDALSSRTPGLRDRLQAQQLFNRYGDELAVNKVTGSLQIYDLVNDTTSDLRPLEAGIVPLNAVWSQDGANLALTFTGIFDYHADSTFSNRYGLDGALISEEAYRDATGNLPPDQNPFYQNNLIETYDLGTGENQVLRATESGKGALLVGVSWSTDNQTLLVQAFQPGRPAGRKYPIYGLQFIERSSFRFFNRNLEQVGSFDPPQFGATGSIYGECISPDELLFVSVTGTNIQPFYYNRASGEFRTLADRAGTYEGVYATRNSRQFVFTHSSYTTPPDLYTIQWDGKALNRLTWLNEELRVTLKAKEYPVSFQLANGQTRVGTLIQPADVPFPPKQRPVVVWQEGGPGGTMASGWGNQVERPYTLLPSFGLSLLIVPLAGREGYDAATYNALYDRTNFGQRDIDEQAEIVGQMIKQGWTRKGMVGITGCSYGGYFTWQSIIRYPDLYAAANPQCSLLDAAGEWMSGYATLMPYIEGLPPWANPEEYRKDSPIYNAGRIRAAVLTFHGAYDYLSVTSAENMHLQLVNQGVNAKMLKFVNEGHGIGTLETQIYAAQEQILWFRGNLK